MPCPKRTRFASTSKTLAFFAAGATIAFSTQLHAAPSNGFRVLHHESVRVASRKDIGANERMSFEAYGQRFDITLAPNDRIARALSGRNSKAVPLQGKIDGLSNSWARITRTPAGVTGVVFDGHALYAIEPASEIADVAVQPLNAAAGETVVYRLSDALMPVETMMCEVAHVHSTEDAPTTAADAFEQLSSELQSFDVAAVTATKQVRVGVVADFEFSRLFANSSTTVEDAIVARMNIVDGIFSSQVGVKISLAPHAIFREEDDPFTKEVASELLTELKDFRNGSLAQRALGITHLMTGRNLSTTTVGIAYIGGLCDAQFGASLSQSVSNTTQAALIAAHEIGHNFGAPHDNESGVCSSTPTSFLMAPQLNGSDQFSACSVQQITNRVNNARCLTTYAPPDARIEAPSAALNATVGTPFLASFRVRASGDGASENVVATVTLPTSLTISSVGANGGTCASGAGTASCNLGTLSAGDSRQIDLNLTPTTTGSLTLQLAVDSSNDPNAGNDTGAITINAAAAAPGSNPTPPPPSGTGSEPPPASDGGGGGGGRLDFLLIGALAAAATLRGALRRRRETT